MKHKIKNFTKKWIIPSGFIEYKTNIQQKKYQKKILFPENQELKDKYQNIERCFILACGPSINNENLKPLKNEFCISVSHFFLHELYNDIKPEFHVYANSHPPFTEDDIKALFRQADNAISDFTNMLLSKKDALMASENGIFKNKQTYKYLNGGDFPVDFTRRIPPVHTASILAIYLAMYLDIKKIYLLGFDHNWILQFGKSNHFYKEDESILTKRGFTGWEDVVDIEQYFKNSAKTWGFYKIINKNVELKGNKIINLSRGSLLDVFEIDSLENILK